MTGFCFKLMTGIEVRQKTLKLNLECWVSHEVDELTIYFFNQMLIRTKAFKSVTEVNLRSVLSNNF